MLRGPGPHVKGRPNKRDNIGDVDRRANESFHMNFGLIQDLFVCFFVFFFYIYIYIYFFFFLKGLFDGLGSVVNTVQR